MQNSALHPAMLTHAEMEEIGGRLAAMTARLRTERLRREARAIPQRTNPLVEAVLEIARQDRERANVGFSDAGGKDSQQ